MTQGISDRPLRILTVTTSYPRSPGDFSGHFVHALAAALVARGHQVTVLAPHAKGLALEEETDGVRIVRFRYAPAALERVAYGDGIPSNLKHSPLAWLSLPGFALGLRAAVRAHSSEADVIHVNWAPTAALAGRALAGRRAVLTLHGSDASLARGGGVWRQLLVSGLSRAKRVVVVAKEQATYLRGSGLLRKSPEVIPSGVDPELLERPRKEPPAEPGFEFLFAGRLVADKGVKQLLEAFGRLSRTHPTARLTFMGAGPEEGALRERATAAALDQEVAFLGALPHAEALDAIAAADAFVLPSHAEGSPLSVTEALALGTPVVATHVGALPELLGADGLLVEPGDTTSLARAMARVMEDRGLVEQLVREGRQRIAAHYTWPAVALAYERVFAGALDD